MDVLSGHLFFLPNVKLRGGKDRGKSKADFPLAATKLPAILPKSGLLGRIYTLGPFR